MQIEETLHLEPLDYHHARPFWNLLEQSRTHLSKWLSWPSFIESEQTFHNFIKGAKQRQVEKTELSFAINHKGAIAGRIGLYYIDRHNKIADIGYWLGQEFEGKGLIFKSCRALISHAFDQMEINRVEIKCAVDNHRSRAIPERLNFVHEGIINQGELINDEFIDLCLYAMLKENWSR